MTSITEVSALMEVLAQKNPITVRRTKFALNKGADLQLSGAMAFGSTDAVPAKTARFANRGEGGIAQPDTVRGGRQLSKSL